jgi:tetratricopeptide (TPR) repeat protein
VVVGFAKSLIRDGGTIFWEVAAMIEDAVRYDGLGRPDPAAAHSPAEFVDALRRLKRWTGLGYRRLERRAEAAGDALPRSTVTAALSRATLPREDLVAAFVRTCGCGDDEVERWVAARRRIAASASTTTEATTNPTTEADDTTAGTTLIARAVTPAQLPAPVAGFVGRSRHLDELYTRLASSGQGGVAPTVVITSIAGPAGVGKTTLAVQWAHLVAERFPDGQLFVNLRGFDPSGAPMSPAEAIRGFLGALGVPPRQVPVGLEAQAALYRSLLVGKQVLIVLDNARDADQVRPLLPGAPSCVVVVTSRDQLAGLIATSGARPLILDLLSAEDARRLLAGRLGLKRIAAEAQATDEIIARCVGLPLALAIVAARAAIRPDFPLAAVAKELHDACGSLDAFRGEDQVTDLRAVFSWSYDRLGPDAARLFRLLGCHPGPDLTASAAASLAGVSMADARSQLGELATAQLVSEHVPGRFTCHDLLRAYAGELAIGVDSWQARTAQLRVLDHYLHSAFAGAALLYPRRQQLTLDSPVPGVSAEDFADQRQASAWFDAELPVLLATVEFAAERGFDAHAWQIAWTLWELLDRQGHWHSLVSVELAAVAAAERLGDRAWQAFASRILGRAYNRLGQHDKAQTHLQRALDLYRELGDKAGQAATHGNLAMLYERLGDHQQALHHDQRTFDLHHATGDVAGQAAALCGLGWGHARLGDYRQALDVSRQALALYHELADGYGAAGAWDSLGYAHHHLGNYSQAIACYRRALGLVRQAGDRYYSANSLTHLGDSHAAAGDHAAARVAWQGALDILAQLGHAEADQIRTKLDALDTA